MDQVIPFRVNKQLLRQKYLTLAVAIFITNPLLLHLLFFIKEGTGLLRQPNNQENNHMLKALLLTKHTKQYQIEALET